MRSILICAIVAGLAVPAIAQERPFLFVTTTTDESKSALRFDYDVGLGESAFQSDTANQPEQRIGLHISLRRLTLLARFGVIDVGSSYQSSQSAEALYSIFGFAGPVSLAGGGGVLHEAGGVNVLQARLVAGRKTDSTRLYGNALLQKPISEGRDTVDLITSVGWARRLSPGLSLGVEAIGEDLEGFWDREEAEGGARLLAGPSLHISPPGARWQLNATGGPVFHPRDTQRSSGALRDLPPETRGTSYAFKVALSIALVASR
jgi:hypothetical protein